MFVEHDGFVGRGQVGLRLRDPRFRLADGIDRLEPPIVAALHEPVGLLADVERPLEAVALRVERSKVGVGRRNAGGQQQSRFLDLEPHTFGISLRGAKRGPVLAEQVEVEVEAERSRAGGVPAARNGNSALGNVLALLLIIERACRIEAREERRAGLLREPLGSAEARRGGGKVGRTGYAFFHQLVAGQPESAPANDWAEA